MISNLQKYSTRRLVCVNINFSALLMYSSTEGKSGKYVHIRCSCDASTLKGRRRDGPREALQAAMQARRESIRGKWDMVQKEMAQFRHLQE